MDKPDQPEEPTKPWFASWFDRAEYEIVYGHRDDDEAAQLIDLVEKVVAPHSGARILDIGCGRGRHAIQFADRGYDVSGVDLSRQSIEDARARAADKGVQVHFEVGDMRTTFCEGCADIVTNLFTAFGYFDNDDDNSAAISAMSSALVTGGWLVQDFLNADRILRTLVPEDERKQNGITIRQSRSVENGRINKTIRLSSDSLEQSFSESVQLLRVDDFDQLYRGSALIMHSVFGDYLGGPFTPNSPRLIMFSRKVR